MYDLYSIDVQGKGIGYPMTKVMSGTKRQCCFTMNYKRNNPNTKADAALRYAVYQGDRLVSSTFSGGGLNAGGPSK